MQIYFSQTILYTRSRGRKNNQKHTRHTDIVTGTIICSLTLLHWCIVRINPRKIIIEWGIIHFYRTMYSSCIYTVRSSVQDSRPRQEL